MLSWNKWTTSLIDKLVPAACTNLDICVGVLARRTKKQGPDVYLSQLQQSIFFCLTMRWFCQHCKNHGYLSRKLFALQKPLLEKTTIDLVRKLCHFHTVFKRSFSARPISVGSSQTPLVYEEDMPLPPQWSDVVQFFFDQLRCPVNLFVVYSVLKTCTPFIFHKHGSSLAMRSRTIL
jgi:hypothetical protein